MVGGSLREVDDGGEGNGSGELHECGLLSFSGVLRTLPVAKDASTRVWFSYWSRDLPNGLAERSQGEFNRRSPPVTQSQGSQLDYVLAGLFLPS